MALGLRSARVVKQGVVMQANDLETGTAHAESKTRDSDLVSEASTAYTSRPTTATTVREATINTSRKATVAYPAIVTIRHQALRAHPCRSREGCTADSGVCFDEKRFLVICT